MKDFNKDYYGMLEQVVAANGRQFSGAWWSTFTGYITRMRAYKVLPPVITCMRAYKVCDRWEPDACF